MAINKVEYGQKTLIDLTSDTVTKETLVKGTSAHNAAGERIEGVFDPAEYLKKTDDGSNLTVAFTEKATRENISTGEKMSVLMGKIKKWFADLTAPAFAQMITTKEDLLATKVTGYVPDAKAVADAYTELNGKLGNYLITVQFKLANTGVIESNGIKSYDSIDVSEAIPSGYSLALALGGYTGDNQFHFFGLFANPIKNTITAYIGNSSNTADSGDPIVILVCLKN